ncbi:MAG: lactate utilization protein [Planctomyces sp.]|nr:lactate utilization protein [Planctomyces sp.]
MSAPAPVSHPVAADRFIADRARAHWHDQALWFVRAKRDRAAAALTEWEQLREAASQIKQHTLSRLADYLEEFERNATARGAVVHFAKDAAEHNEIVLGILQRQGARRIVKSKSMLTEECHLNPFLERHGVEVVDTDLGEWIVQLREEPPSHIVLPAIHTRREEIGELFHEKIGTEAGATDPAYLTHAARLHLRQKFLSAEAGITGVNFAIAETGGFVVCTNEGNADLGTSLPPVHIACMGIEKLIPRAQDLPVFLRLLARSATGQPITTYSTHFCGPRAAGCVQHIVIVDNGRSAILADPDFRRSLNCIRCGACMNTCPVYRRSGGHSYQAVVPGPIGSILAPSQDPARHASLPHACSLCGSCSDVCPVKIDLHLQLYTWRNRLVLKGLLPRTKRWSMRAASVVLRSPRLFSVAGGMARFWLRHLPRALVYNRWNPWGRQRELPEAPARSFRQLYAERQRKDS